MIPSRPKRIRLAVVIGTCVFGLFLAPILQHPALASPTLQSDPVARRAPAVNLRLDSTSATRVMADLTGAAQEDDAEKPKSMEEKAKAPTTKAGAAATAKKETPPPDKFAFVKDWPFWVIVGGVVILAVGGYMLLRNSNEKAPCAMTEFPAGCFQ